MLLRHVLLFIVACKTTVWASEQHVPPTASAYQTKKMDFYQGYLDTSPAASASASYHGSLQNIAPIAPKTSFDLMKGLFSDVGAGNEFRSSHLDVKPIALPTQDYSAMFAVKELDKYTSLPQRKPKPIIREGYTLPPINWGETKAPDLFKHYGVDVGVQKWAYSSLSHLLLAPNDKHVFKPTDYFKESLLGKDEYGEFKDMDIESLDDDQILRLFKKLTASSYFSMAPFDKIEKLNELLANERARILILRASRNPSDDLILEAFKNSNIFNKTFGILIDTDGFFDHLAQNPQFYIPEGTGKSSLCESLFKELKLGEYSDELEIFLSNPFVTRHLIQCPPDEKGSTPLKDFYILKVFFHKTKEVAILMKNDLIMNHLMALVDEKGINPILLGLQISISESDNQTTSLFYKLPRVFQHLTSSVSNGALGPSWLNIGLLSVFNFRNERHLREILNPHVTDYIQQNQQKEGLAPRLISKAIETRNPVLSRALVDTLGLLHVIEKGLDFAKHALLWNQLTETEQSDFIRQLLRQDPKYDPYRINQLQQKVSAFEHGMTHHPDILRNMKMHGFKKTDDYETYDKLRQRFQKESRIELVPTKGFSVLSRKDNIDELAAIYQHCYALEEEFLTSIHMDRAYLDFYSPIKSSKASVAHHNGVFGQGVEALVVEVSPLNEDQKSGLLSSHLTDKTVFKGDDAGSNAAHNIGVTSLVSTLAPLSSITSATTRMLDPLTADIKGGRFSFINCSWGPADALTEDTNISIFSSVKVLTQMLGVENTVLVQAAGNDSLNLSDPVAGDQPRGIFYSKLLKRLTPEQLSNLILAVNLKPTLDVSDSSNTPGLTPNIYRNTLSAQGSMTHWLEETGQHYIPIKDGGTSSAAPIITAAGVLLKSYKPHFTARMIKDCLLHSARREFTVTSEKGDVYVYENEPKAEIVNQRRFSHETYGMGVLDVKRAMQFANRLERFITKKYGDFVSQALSYDEYETLRFNAPRWSKFRNNP